ncbi:MAG: hypothetical protein Q8N88_07045 [Nanoarchaeota archaeon]|nr:hypothetical protein [Nanoarchaeota archaeon]
MVKCEILILLLLIPLAFAIPEKSNKKNHEKRKWGSSGIVKLRNPLILDYNLYKQKYLNVSIVKNNSHVGVAEWLTRATNYYKLEVINES